MAKKNIFVSILFFLITLSSVQGQELETIMQTGNDYFQNKQYQDAIKSYESIMNKGYISGDLFYNLGNSYFRLNQIGKAILYYEKAMKISPGNDDAAYNLRIANARTIDKTQNIPTLFFVQWWNILLSTFTSTGWQVIVFIFYILLLVCIAIYFLFRNLRTKKLSFIFGILNFGVLAFSVIFFFSSLSRESSYNEGILLKSVVSTKISPDSKSNDAFVIHEGIKFEIEDKVNNWVKIKLSDGKIGWITLNTFEVI